MFRHLLYTWLLANILHPVLFFLIQIGVGGSRPINQADLVESFLSFSAASLVFSAPCLLLGIAVLYLIRFTRFKLPARFILWLFASAMMVVLMFAGLLYFFLQNVELGELKFAFPAIAATWLAIIIRWRQFKDLDYLQYDPG